MGEKLTYYDFAEDDFQYFFGSYKANLKHNTMCAMAQNSIEKYLKYIIEKYITNKDCSYILKSHSLLKLIRFIQENLNDFDINSNKIKLCDGYYFSARYPGEDSCMVKEEDIEICKDVLIYCKQFIDEYIKNH